MHQNNNDPHESGQKLRPKDRTIENWNQLSAEALGAFPCKPKICRNRVREAIINGVK